MWISKAEYETLKNYKHDAEEFYKLVKNITEKKVIEYCDDFILVSRDIWDMIVESYNIVPKNMRDIQAELKMYKVKYHEMKINTQK